MSGERLRGASVAIGVLQRIHVDHDPVITREAHVFVLAEADRFEEALAALRSTGDDDAAARAGFALRAGHQREAAAFSFSASSRRRILPDAVRGTLSMNSTSRTRL